MEQNVIFHGSNVEVAKPRILQNGFYKDFGYGFYCTNIEKQAKRWAITRKGDTIVNRYKYIPDANLKVLCFEQMTDEWLDFVAACRKGIEHDWINDYNLKSSDYDITDVDKELATIIPTPLEMGEVYQRLIMDTMTSKENYVEGIIRVIIMTSVK